MLLLHINLENTIWGSLLDALIDSLKLLPFLLLVYFIIELIEAKSGNGFKKSGWLKGSGAPLLGAATGLVPQCGFSVMATNLFASKHIGMGTLLAVYIATSDEALPIMLSDVTNLPDMFLPKLLPLFLIKFVLAIIVGYTIFFILRKKEHLTSPAELHEHHHGLKDKAHHDDKNIKRVYATVDTSDSTCPEEINGTNKDEAMHNETSLNTDVGCCGHSINGKESKLKRYLIHPLIHSLKIFVYILVINLLFGTIIFFVGEQGVSNALSSVGYFQPLLAAIVGLVPNCASSVLLTELFLNNSIALGSAVAGLSVNAGLAFAVLFKQNKNVKQNLIIISITLAVSAITGTIIMLCMPTL